MLSKTGNQVYLSKGYRQDKASFAKEQKEATYQFEGKEQLLKFDGKVDKTVLSTLKNTDDTLTSSKQLASVVDKVEEQKPTMDNGDPATLDFGTSSDWVGARKKSHPKAKSTYEYVFTSPDGKQQAVFTDDGRAKLRTRGDGLFHQIVNKVYNNSDKPDVVFYIAESITVDDEAAGSKDQYKMPFKVSQGREKLGAGSGGEIQVQGKSQEGRTNDDVLISVTRNQATGSMKIEDADGSDSMMVGFNTRDGQGFLTVFDEDEDTGEYKAEVEVPLPFGRSEHNDLLLHADELSQNEPDGVSSVELRYGANQEVSILLNDSESAYSVSNNRIEVEGYDN